ncbi:MAG: glycosyltransferase family 4 protein [Candidatus Hydrogenedentes bacterium]|nr:glycosyltransferase family 4 protein [Candidatus Hydrogenedentota bacterium]
MATQSSKRLRIAQIASYYLPALGGVTRVVQYLSEELAHRGHDVHVLTSTRVPKGNERLGGAGDEDVNGVWVHRFPAWGNVGHMCFFPGFLPVLKRLRPDVIHCHGYRRPHGDLAGFVSRRLEIPILLHVHGGFDPHYCVKHCVYAAYDRLARAGVVNRFDYYIGLTEAHREKLLQTGVPSDRMSVVPNAAKDSCFETVDPADFKRRFEIADKRVILFLGMLHRAKRPDLVIRALPRIVALEPRAFVLFAGPDAGEAGHVAELATRLDVAPFIRWIGPLHGRDTHAALAASELLVLPSDEDAFPLVMLEAMAHGRPAVVSDAVGPASIVAESNAGIVFPSGRHDRLAEAVLSIMQNGKLRDEMGKRARDTARARFTVSAAVDRLENIYFRLCPPKAFDAATHGRPERRPHGA